MAGARVTQPEAAAYALARRRAKASLACYAMERGLWPAKHHLILLMMLERAFRGECRRGMVFMGPGTAKSMYTSRIAPPWGLAQQSPHGMPWDILACSHTMGLSEDFSKSIRSSVRDEPNLLGYGLSDDFTAVEHWATTKGDHYRIGSVGNAIAGKRADIGIIDDPVPSREQADSITYREKTWKWYQDDFRKRVKPTGSIIIVMTRWHDDDLAGRILPPTWNGESGTFLGRDGREEWEVVSMPSLCHTPATDPLGRALGESVWPEWMPREWLETERATSSPRSWSAMHQQQPAPEDGDFFRREWFGRYTAIPTGCRYFLSSDFATPNGNDATCHAMLAVDASNRLYVADLWHQFGAETAIAIDAALDMIAKYKPACWLNEKGVIWRMLEAQVRMRMRERNVFCPDEQYARSKSKEETAQTIRDRWSQGMVMLPEQAPWLADLERELLRFPAGHDDRVDALALFGLHLDKVIAPPKKPLGQYRAQGWTVGSR